MAELDAQSIINFIANAPKQTPARVTLAGDLTDTFGQKRSRHSLKHAQER